MVKENKQIKFEKMYVSFGGEKYMFGMQFTKYIKIYERKNSIYLL